MFETGTLIGAWVASSLIAGAPFVIEVIAGPDFAPAEDVLRIQAVGLLATFSGAVFFYALLSLHRQVALLALTSGAFALNVLLVAVLLPSLGPEGAALGTVIAEVALVASGGVYLRRVVPTVRLEVTTALRVAPAFAVCASFALVSGVPHAVLAIAAAALFPVLALLCGAVPREVIVEVRRFASGLPSLGRAGSAPGEHG
jgi:O-antigen/teichoic acid export membrane protein